MYGREEPEIFSQPIGPAKDLELAPLPDEQQTYGTRQTYVTEQTYATGNIGPQTVPYTEDDEVSEQYHTFVFPEERKLGSWSTAFLIINRVVGNGIYSTPSTIIRYTDSVGATLLFWVLGGLMTFCGLFVYLEYGTALPRSGGEKVYLERVYQRPRYLATCIFAVQFVLFAVSTANSISFSSYILKAATNDAENGSWLNRGISVAAITAVCLIHSLTPRLGIWLSNGLGAFKLVLLLLVVCTGFAALAGRTVTPSPHNFSSFHGPGSAHESEEDTPASHTAGYALALLQVLYSYSGWENANYVRIMLELLEVKS
jgi:amino acid transporter